MGTNLKYNEIFGVDEPHAPLPRRRAKRRLPCDSCGRIEHELCRWCGNQIHTDDHDYHPGCREIRERTAR